MSITTDAMRKILEKCDILLENEIISKELLLQSFSDFLLNTVEKEKHNVGVVLHTGSVCFEAIALIYAIVSCMVYNETDSEDIIESLGIGDAVIYTSGKSPKKCVFQGFEKMNGEKYIKLISQRQERGHMYTETVYVPPKWWRKIIPYYGESTRLDSRGLRKKSGIREEFFKSVLDYEDANIPAMTDISVAVVMPRDKAEFLLDSLRISFEGKTVKPLELIAASYFTENDEHRYGGNTGKIEANIKFTSKVSVARDLVLSKEGNKHIGVVVSGNEIVSKGQTEIPELLNRRSIQYVYVLMNIDFDNSTSIINETESPNVFACSKEYLLSNSLRTKSDGKYCKELSKQVDAVIERDIEPHILKGDFSWDDYKLVKKALLYIKNSDFVADEKDEFIIQSYSLVNLFLTAVFKVSVLEKCIGDDKLEIVSPIERLKELTEIADRFPEVLKAQARTILDFLEIAYLYLEEKSGKEIYLKELLKNNSNKMIAVIVPKAYYATLIRECGFYELMDDESLLTVVTANRFDNTVMYDHIVVVGNFNGKRFDTFRCRAAQRIETLLYDFESHFFKYKMRKAKKAENQLNALVLNTEFIEDDEAFESLYYSEIPDDEILEVTNMDAEVDEYVNRLNEIATFKSLGSASFSNGSTMSEIVAVGTFESGEKVLFTKNYKAYVFDEDNGIVKEVKVNDLTEGDSLVFAQRNSETRDIVDTILSNLVEEQKVSDEIIKCYQLSKLWKSRLVDYMQDMNMSAKIIASKMIANGAKVQEITIRGWLDEDSHTVGPRSIESIQQIATLVENEDMFENAQVYFDACSTIRKIRREILNQVGEAIINKLSGRQPKNNTIMEDIYNRIDSVALILRLETISFTEREVPMNLTNRPINL